MPNRIKWVIDHIYQPIYDFKEFFKLFFCVVISNHKSKKYKEFYIDHESLEVLELRQRFNKSMIKTPDVSIFLDFFLKKKRTLYLSDVPKDSLIIFDKKNKKKAEYTSRLINSVQGYNCQSLEYDNSPQDKDLIAEKTIIPIGSDKLIANIQRNYSFNNIWNCKYEYIVSTPGKQYLDVFDPVDNEIIIDAGACTGETTKDFLDWGGDKVLKIYAFESDPQNCITCREYFERECDDRVVLVNKGCWDRSETLSVVGGDATPGSRIGTGGGTKVEVVAIDDVLGDDKVTFIKMDIEGAELPALKGARDTIIQNKPRLAICVYHKPDDIYKIPQYILSLVPDYRFYLRHYSTCDWETVLYAYVQE